MKLTLTTLALLLGATHAMAQDGRITTAFDPGWRFLKADAKDAQKPAFNDAKWRALALPHDWSIEGPYDQSNPTGTRRRLPAGRYRLVPQEVHPARLRGQAPGAHRV
jgi:beta-galactosidase